MVDVIIPTYNNYLELKRCLLALSTQTMKDFTVWIAVDGSEDMTLQELSNVISSLSFEAHILEHPDKQNRGRSSARNLALPFIKNPFIWFLDSDMIPEPSCLQAHLNICTQYKNSVSVGAVFYLNANTNLWAKYIATRGHVKFKHLNLLPWNYFITANSLVPTEYFVQLNGFDENIKKYGGEDMELAYRMFLKYSPSFYKNDLARCSTIQNKTLSQALMQLEEYGREGLPYIYQKHPQMPYVYLLDKLHGNPLKRIGYQFLTNPLWSKFFLPCLNYFPFAINQKIINYLVISSIFKGYLCSKQNLNENLL